MSLIFMSLISGLAVVHREGCGLCDEMIAALAALGERIALPAVSVLDVDADPDLSRRFSLDVPVLLLDGNIVCKHRLDEGELRRLLRR
jgi:predicted thioredoxin/glutaredoxin